MAVTFTKEYYINLGLFIVALVALGLSIWAFATPCKKEGFGNQPEFGDSCCPGIEYKKACINSGEFPTDASYPEMTCNPKPVKLSCQANLESKKAWDFECLPDPYSN